MAVSRLALSSRSCVSITFFAWLCSALLCHRESVSPSLCPPGCVLSGFATENLPFHHFVQLAVCCLASSLRSCVSITLSAWLCAVWLCHRESVSENLSLCSPGCVLSGFVTQNLSLHYFVCCIPTMLAHLSPTICAIFASTMASSWTPLSRISKCTTVRKLSFAYVFVVVILIPTYPYVCLVVIFIASLNTAILCVEYGRF
jgi:hypothetical protein